MIIILNVLAFILSCMYANIILDEDIKYSEKFSLLELQRNNKIIKIMLVIVLMGIILSFIYILFPILIYAILILNVCLLILMLMLYRRVYYVCNN